jgi:hypothetical protein
MKEMEARLDDLSKRPLGHPSHDPRPGRVPINGQVPTPPIAYDPNPGKPPTNPKQLYGDKKPPLHLIHMIAQLHEAAALHGGKRKYGENNYLATEVEAMTYVGAILRHLGQWVSGERVDRKELVHHLGAIRACTNILLTAEATGMLIDNRPCVGPVEDNIYPGPQCYREATEETFAEVEKTIEHLNRLYPNLL